MTPASAPFGTVQTISISELEALTNYTVEITVSETLRVAYRRIHTSDEDGVIEIDIFAEEGDTAGLQAIAVYDEAGETIAAGEFTIEAPPERDAAVALDPARIAAGGTTDNRGDGIGRLRQRDRANHVQRRHLDRHHAGARQPRRRGHNELYDS